jgi:hypothetical protein
MREALPCHLWRRAYADSLAQAGVGREHHAEAQGRRARTVFSVGKLSSCGAKGALRENKNSVLWSIDQIPKGWFERLGDI